MSDQTFERAVSTWLESGSDRTPPAAVYAVLLAVKTTPQERDLRISRRFTTMPTFLRLAAAIAIVAVIGAGALIYTNREPSVGGQPTPKLPPASSPTASPTASLLDTSTWVEYTSDRYGFTLKHPAGWQEQPADHDWTLDGDAADWMSSGQDAFIGPNIRVSFWTIPLDSATTFETPAEVEAWVEEYCQTAAWYPCDGIHGGAVPLCLEVRDCHPGLLIPFESDVHAFFAGGGFGDNMVVGAVWWADSDPATAAYGGSRRLLEAFLSTMDVWPADARPSPGS